MQHTGSIQMAYKSPINDVCAVCKHTIRAGQYLTRHMVPDPRRLDYKTGKKKLVPYTACDSCAPFIRLEQTTGELHLRELAERAKFENQETQVMLPVVRSSTPRPGSSLRPIRLEKETRRCS
jgi:hypothetical protein